MPIGRKLRTIATVLPVLLLSTTLVVAQDVEVRITAPPGSSFESMGNLSATISGASVSVSLKVSGQNPAANTERQKCRDLLEVAGNDFDSVFKNAVSSYRVDFALTEARSDEGLGKAWRDAINKANSDGKLAFNLADTRSYFPIIADLSLSIRDVQYQSPAPNTTSQRLLQRALEGVIVANFKSQLATWNSSGILRASTDAQAAVCYALLVANFKLQVRFTGRTFDRFQRLAILDRACFDEVLRGISDSFAKRKLKPDDVKDLSSFSFLVGIHGARITRQSGFFSGSEPNRFCPSSSGDISDSTEVLTEWQKVIATWFELAQANKTFALLDAHQFDRFGFKLDTRPTNIWFEYEIPVEGGAR